MLTAVCVTSYYIAFQLVRAFSFDYRWLPCIGFFIAVSGMLPGYFFFTMQKQFGKAKDLFFHENNGFLLGIVVSLLGAVFLGKGMLTWAPLLGVLPAVLLFLGGTQRRFS